MTRVKICGITRLDDALAAAEYGADALGFVFYEKSPRFILPERAAEIVSKFPPFVTPVALFVNEEREKVREILSATGINVVQFHGDENPVYVSAFVERVIKAIRVIDEGSIKAAHEYDVNALLLDSYSADLYGGTGETFDWELLKEGNLGERLILAGGLNPENVSEAVSRVKPYGVDVSSGVEESPGIKNHDKVREFIRRAKSLG